MTNVVDLNVNRAVDASGNYLAGAKAYFSQSGTSTPVTVYSDAAATTPHGECARRAAREQGRALRVVALEGKGAQR